MVSLEHSTSQDPLDLEAAFDILVCQTVAQLENGEAIDVAEVCTASPELAPRLRQLLPALEAVTQLRPTSGARPTDRIRTSLVKQSLSKLRITKRREVFWGTFASCAS